MPDFTITAQPDTDVWRKPPSTDKFDAALHHLTSFIPLKQFHSAQATFSAPWTTRYDQAGLLLHLTSKGKKDRWIKAGVEFYQDQPYLASVACFTFADWCLVPNQNDERKVSIEFRREQDELGKSLWLYQVVKGERKPLREVCWVFDEEEEWTVRVSAMACRPAKKEDVKGKEELVVSFEEASVKLLE